ncbi:MAG: precorrin-6Y methyltransferase [Frankiales bacterium]|nr:precorrin-6Y methyltransferase [Frankiales bacterium]
MITVVGVGADGWAGLTSAAQQAISSAGTVLGAPRQLALVPVNGLAWRTLPELEALLDEHPECVLLASGDPMHFGIGATLAGRREIRVIPAVSSIALACARLGWAQQDIRVVSLVGRAPCLGPLRDGERLLVLSADATTPAKVADLLAEQGFARSTVSVLSDLGGPAEHVGEPISDLNIVAVECHGGALPLVPGLPDDAFENDGQITKREVRAVVLSLLAPQPDQLLWDVGAGTGSVGIEWARAGGRTVAVERDAEKSARVTRNASALGVPAVQVVTGDAPDVLGSLERPDAVFVGGGATAPGVLDACWDALPAGGRLVANAVTVESEALLLAWQAKHGGELLRLSVQRTAPVGSFTGWKPMTTVTVWSLTK